MNNMKLTCTGCTYKGTCGDEERTAPCKGYKGEVKEESPLEKIRKRKIQQRVRQLKAMHELMRLANGENIYFSWVSTAVPDCPCDSDFEEIAETDEYFDDALDTFVSLIGHKDYR